MKFPSWTKGRYFGEIYNNPEDFRNLYMIDEDLFVSYQEIFEGNTFLEVGDNNMWCEIVVIKGEWKI